MTDSSTSSELTQSQKLAHTHYENFPVAPFFLPKSIRQPIALIYRFARVADDLADEGDLPPQERLNALDRMSEDLHHIQNQQPIWDPFMRVLGDMIHRHKLPIRLFHALLTAFKHDVTVNRYEDETALLGYCQNSANPVGRLLLHLNQSASEENLAASDCICTALQLINFLQDLKSDLEKRDRLYIPMKDLKTFDVHLSALKNGDACPATRALIHHQWDRAQQLMTQGKPLGQRLTGRFGFNIRLIISGGQHVLNALDQRTHFFQRPTLSVHHWLKMAKEAILKK